MPTVTGGGFFGSITGFGRRGDYFPSPWLDMATLNMPQFNKNALEWCQYIWQTNGMYRQAMERVISYFLTEVMFEPIDQDKPLGDDEKERYADVFDNTYRIKQTLQDLDRNRLCYGNGFATLIVPFIRFLVCPKCKNQYKLQEMGTIPIFKFKYINNSFTATCPNCEKSGEWTINDMPDDLDKKLRIKHWNPHEMEILHDPWTEETDYLWRIPETYKNRIRKGELYLLQRAPEQVLKAVANNQFFLFNRGSIFHMKEPTLAGIRNRGWGISRTLTNFRDAWYVQVLRRYNEAIGLDYIIPFRVLTPEVRSTAGGISAGDTSDPLRMTDLGDFTGKVRAMLRLRRRDPASWHVLPFPIQYRALGGDARELAPTELLAHAEENLLNAAGAPMELYKGTLQLQTAPVSLRLFEATWTHLVGDNNRFLRWLVEQTSQLLGLPLVQAKMRRVTHADDFNLQMAALQMAMGGSVSMTTALRGLGLKYDDEQRRLAEEARKSQEVQARMQEEMDQSAFGEQIAKGQPAGDPAAAAGGAPGAALPAGAAPAGEAGVAPTIGALGPPTGKVSPEDMMAQAESVAMQLLSMPETQKDSELRALKQKDEMFHSLVRAKMDEIRQQARTAGGAMLLGQQGAAQGAGAQGAGAPVA